MWLTMGEENAGKGPVLGGDPLAIPLNLSLDLAYYGRGKRWEVRSCEVRSCDVRSWAVRKRVNYLRFRKT